MKTKKRGGNGLFLAAVVMIAMSLAIFCILLGYKFVTPQDSADPTTLQTPTTLPQTTVPTTVPATVPDAPPEPPPVTKVSTATIGSVGDVLFHDRVIASGYDAATGTYNYDSIFSAFSSFVSQVDYAVANMEGTMCGTENGYKYSGYPSFNAPDAVADALKAAGFDMLLTANNHTFDTGTKGFFRTQQVIADRGFDYIGTRQEEESKNYLVKEINGIRIGMICYTYNTGEKADGTVSLNDIPLTAQASGLVNSFDYLNLEGFYEKLGRELSQMREDGAEAIMLYIHWGDEYHTKENEKQRKIAQAVCDMGVDVIVGNHAHVVQPVELLTNTNDESQKTLCLYSMGNILSNIRQSTSKPIHVEDGMLFSVTFAKYSDGTVVLEGAEILPTWVETRLENDVTKFTILPMDEADRENWSQKCLESYNRTMKIVGQGLESANQYYAQNQTETEKEIGCRP